MLSNRIFSFLALSGPQPGASPEEIKKNTFMQIGMMVFFVLIFYVMLIRPQQKKAKEQNQMLKGLKAGDRITTSSGIVGVVVSLKDNTVTLRSGDSKMEVTKSSVTEVTERATP
jgi:preprotein translocase subunit YajC